MKGERKVLIIAALLALLLFVLGSSATIQSVTCQCDGVTFEDPTENLYECGQCTWYAAYRRTDIPGGGWFNASNWNDAAMDNYSVGAIPYPGALAVYELGIHGADAGAGHVAYVESVFHDTANSFVVSEMNWENVCFRDGRVDYADDGISFIYPPSDTPVLLWPYDGYHVMEAIGETIVLQWYGDFDRYSLTYTDGKGATTAWDIQEPRYELRLSAPARIEWSVCGYNQDDGFESCSDWQMFDWGACIAEGLNQVKPSGDESCNNPTPVPTSTPFPTITPTATLPPTTTATPNPPTPVPTPTATPAPQTYFVSGFVTVPQEDNRGLSGVTISISGYSSVYTDDSGHYRKEDLPAGGTYALTPGKDGWVFDPPDREVHLTGDLEQLNFAAHSYDCCYYIRGLTTGPEGSENRIGGVLIEIVGVGTEVSDGTGQYTRYGLPAGRYTLTSSKQGFECGPVKEISVPPSQEQVNFVCVPEPPPTAEPPPTPAPTPTPTPTPTATSCLEQITQRWRCQVGDDCYDSFYDLNGDRIINTVDVMISSNRGQRCADPTKGDIVGRVLSTTGEPFSGYTVHAGSTVTTVTDGDGGFGFYDLTPGITWYIWLYDVDFPPGCQVVEPSTGEWHRFVMVEEGEQRLANFVIDCEG